MNDKEKIFKIAQQVFDSKNFERINCKFEDDIVDCLAKKLSSELGQKWDTEINENGEKSDRSKKERRVDLCCFQNGTINIIIEVKVLEQYKDKCNNHFFPYIFYDNIPPNIKEFNGCKQKEIEKLNCFEENNGNKQINHKEEGQLFKDIIKILKIEEKFCKKIEKYLLFYLLTNKKDTNQSVHCYCKIKARLEKLFQHFDTISNKKEQYLIKTGNNFIGASYSPLQFDGFFSNLGRKCIGKPCSGNKNLCAEKRCISVVLLHFDENHEFSFELKKSLTSGCT